MRVETFAGKLFVETSRRPTPVANMVHAPSTAERRPTLDNAVISDLRCMLKLQQAHYPPSSALYLCTSYICCNRFLIQHALHSSTTYHPSPIHTHTHTRSHQAYLIQHTRSFCVDVQRRQFRNFLVLHPRTLFWDTNTVDEKQQQESRRNSSLCSRFSSMCLLFLLYSRASPFHLILEV